MDSDEDMDRIAEYELKKRTQIMREAALIKRYEVQKGMSDDKRTIDDVMFDLAEARVNQYKDRPGGVRGNSDTAIIDEAEARLKKEHPLVSRIFAVMTPEEHAKFCQINGRDERKAYFYSFAERLSDDEC